MFDSFFAGYDRAFVLPNEKEDADGFRACLRLNHGAENQRLEREYGRFREICLVARASAGQAFVGGANFIALEVAGDGGPVISANLNYIFIDAEARGQGWFRPLVEAVGEAIRLALGGGPSGGEPLIFIEQNDPLRMSAEDYARDTAFTGLDQFDRLRIWARQGARIVDHPYTQPPLTPEAEADDSLVYGALTSRPDIAAHTLRDHLRKFFGISVLKGAAIADTPIAAEQIATLDRLSAQGARIPLLDPSPFLARVRNRAEAERLLAPYPRSFREAIRGAGS